MTNREYYALLLDLLNDVWLPLTPAQSEWFDWYSRTRQLMDATQRHEFDNAELEELEDR